MLSIKCFSGEIYDNVVHWSCYVQGTQSSNPHNDYCQHFVDTGQRPQNFIRDTGIADRFEEYPKLKELIRLKVIMSKNYYCCFSSMRRGLSFYVLVFLMP